MKKQLNPRPKALESDSINIRPLILVPGQMVAVVLPELNCCFISKILWYGGYRLIVVEISSSLLNWINGKGFCGDHNKVEEFCLDIAKIKIQSEIVG